MAKVTAFIHRDIRTQIQSLYQRGGGFQKAAEKLKTLVYDLNENKSDPMDGLSKLPLTNHGESRIMHCVKYDLTQFCRLITIQDNGWLVLLYAGTHDEVDRWLNQNKGLQVGVRDIEKGLFEIFKSEDITDEETRINPESDFSGGKLYEKLKHYYEIVVKDLPTFIRKALENFETTTDENEIFDVASAISNLEQQELVFDVFMLLRAGKVDEAKNRILSYQDQIKLITELPKEELRDVRSNDQYLNLDDLDEDDLKLLMNNKSWIDWMLFMHPAQKVVVNRDFKGSARLLGVSGSGKTCVIVKRAVRLAKKYPDQKVLILTLNQSLSKLISTLIARLAESMGNSETFENIKVKSFWELCRDLIIEIRNHKFDERVLGPRTDKHGETIDEIWDEYYLCKSNNDDADVMAPVHSSLLARGIYPQDYLKQEFDWVRSFLSIKDRNLYKSIEREGRTIPLIESERLKIIQGLEGWERKMNDVGAIDYLGLANELYSLIDQIEPLYRCILIDEIQDFGTLEMEIIRKLVPEGENDLFVTGDIAQQVYTKHHKIKNAGITILPEAYLKILKNYRNSREILSAANEVFIRNTKEEQFKSDDFEILKPEYANFSSAKPFLRKAGALDEEFASAIQYLRNLLSEKEKGCITICGFTIFEVQKIGLESGLPVLDGSTNLGKENIYLSDLEQSKGFEFDRMIILNANQDVIPNPSLPKEEWYREISKFYVAMTRAKKELVVSYSNNASSLFDDCKAFFNEDSWIDHTSDVQINVQISRSENNTVTKDPVLKMTGREFLYDKKAIGLSRDIQNKLLEMITGKNVNLGGKRVGWINLGELKSEVLSKRDLPHLNKLFGSVVFKELESLLLRI